MQEPRGRAERDGATSDAERFDVQFVVVDRATGAIVSSAESSAEKATEIASAYNSADPGIGR